MFNKLEYIHIKNIKNTSIRIKRLNLKVFAIHFNFFISANNNDRYFKMKLYLC